MPSYPDEDRPSSQASRDSYRLLKSIRDDGPPINEDGVYHLCYSLMEQREALRRGLLEMPRKNDYDHQSGPWLEELTNLPKTTIYSVRDYMISRPPTSCSITHMAANHGFILKAVRPQLFTIKPIEPRIVDGESRERGNATFDPDRGDSEEC